MNTYVVEVTRRSHGSAELERQGPVTSTGSLVRSHLVALAIVVPRARNVAALDVGGGAEGEGGSSSGGRHDD